jgi:hypothetical protein
MPALAKLPRTPHMNFLLGHQLAAILTAFAVGSLLAALVYRNAKGSLSWKIADFVWIALGGLGALTALLANGYQDERGRVDRQIDISYATSKAFEATTSRFRLLHCDHDRQGPQRAATLVLCGKVDVLSASAADNQNLPLFLDVAQTRTPLSALDGMFGGGAQMAASTGMSHDQMMARVTQFDVGQLLSFAASDAATRAAMASLDASSYADISAEYQVIANTYDDLIDQLGRVKAEWDYLQANSLVLTLQVLALCMISFAAPFRLGKSLNDF